MDIPSYVFGGDGPEIYFLHANGYPPACYAPLLTHLSSYYRISAMIQRPLWSNSRPDELKDWTLLSDDLMDFLKVHQTKPAICIGHSMGAIAILRAALRFPQRFSAIILIDPVLFPPYIIRLWQILHALGLEYHAHPLVPAAKNRRQYFDDLDKLFQGYRRKLIFRYMDDQSLRAYIKGISCPTDGGYQLCYSSEWESRIYITSTWRDMDIWRCLPTIKPSTLILRGMETDTFWAKTERLVKRRQPNIQINTIANATHLVPLEQPKVVSELIHGFLEAII